MTGKVHVLPENYSGIRVVQVDYSGKDLVAKDLSNSVFDRCNFDNTDLTKADCRKSSFVGSTFRGSNCYCTNFAEANLGATIFEPSDAYGMIISLNCTTFTNMHISQKWWYAWLMFATQMVPSKGPNPDDVKKMLIGSIGATRYIKLKALFGGRDL